MTPKCTTCLHRGMHNLYPCTDCIYNGSRDHYTRAEVCKNCTHCFKDELERTRCHKKKRRVVSIYGSCDKWRERRDIV